MISIWGMHRIILVRWTSAKCSDFSCSKRPTSFWPSRVAYLALSLQIPHFHIWPTSQVRYSPNITAVILTLDPNPVSRLQRTLFESSRPFRGLTRFYQHRRATRVSTPVSVLSTTESHPLSAIASLGAVAWPRLVHVPQELRYFSTSQKPCAKFVRGRSGANPTLTNAKGSRSLQPHYIYIPVMPIENTW